MPKPVCVPCARFFRMRKGGFYFIEGMPVGPDRPQPGKAEPDKWRPYKIWAADKWECEGCGATILSGFGLNPIGYQHEDGFEKTARTLGADQLQVNDC
jgi:hypothetical protein